MGAMGSSWGQHSGGYWLGKSGWQAPVSGTAGAPSVGGAGAQVNTQAMQPMQGQQQSLANALAAQAAGQGGPTMAGQQLAAGTQQSLNSAIAAQAANRGQPAGQAVRNAQSNEAMIGQQAAGQAAGTRAQEQQNAQGQLGNVLNQGINTNLQVGVANQQAQQNLAAAQQAQYEYGQNLAAQQAAQYNQEVGALTNLNVSSQDQAQNSAMNTITNSIGGAVNAGMAVAASDENVKTMIDDGRSRTHQFLQSLGGANASPNSLASPGQATGGEFQTQSQGGTGGFDSGKFVSALSSILGPGNGTTQSADQLADNAMGQVNPADPTTAQLADPDDSSVSEMANSGSSAISPGDLDITSDENEKTDVDEKKEDFLSALKSHSYKYKDPSMPGAAPGTHFGPMAQEIEQGGPIGKSLVQSGPDGVKRVDTGRLALALASAGGELHNRISAIEKLLAMKDKEND